MYADDGIAFRDMAEPLAGPAAYQAFATSGARVSEPGTNLVGPRWNGDPKPDEYNGEPHGKAEGEASHPKRS